MESLYAGQRKEEKKGDYIMYRTIKKVQVQVKGMEYWWVRGLGWMVWQECGMLWMEVGYRQDMQPLGDQC